MYTPQFHVVLYQPEIAYNAGAVGRTCVAAGAKLWLVRPLGFQITDRRLRRAGLDYWPHLVWEAVDDWWQLRARLANSRLWFLSKRAAQPYTEARFRSGDAFVLGPESAGLPPSILQTHSDTTLRLPIRPQVRSLNVSVAAGIILYEACRQVGFPADASPPTEVDGK